MTSPLAVSHFRHRLIATAASLLLAVPACSTDRSQTVGQATGVGALLGAAVGAGIGYAVDKGDGAAWGAALGAAAGAGTGYVVGSNTADDKEEYARLESTLQGDIAQAQTQRSTTNQQIAAIHSDLDRLEQEHRNLLASRDSYDVKRAQLVARKNELDRSIEATRAALARVDQEINYQRGREGQYPADWPLRQSLDQQVRGLEDQRLALDQSLSRALALQQEMENP